MNLSVASFQQCCSRYINPEDLSKAVKSYFAKAMTGYGQDQFAESCPAGIVPDEGYGAASRLWQFTNDAVPHMFLTVKKYRGQNWETADEETKFPQKDFSSVKLLKADVRTFFV